MFDARNRLLAMFMAFRYRLAAWLHDGTVWGAGDLRRWPASDTAADWIAMALLEAEERQAVTDETLF